MVWNSFASMISSALGSVYTNKQNYKYTKKLQDHQNAFSAYMSNTAHQREVEDLRKAGLNPILSANGGASTPTAGSSTFSSENPVSSARQAFMDNQRLENETSSVANDTKRVKNESESLQYDNSRKIQETARMNEETRKMRLENDNYPILFKKMLEETDSRIRSNNEQANSARSQAMYSDALRNNIPISNRSQPGYIIGDLYSNFSNYIRDNYHSAKDAIDMIDKFRTLKGQQHRFKSNYKKEILRDNLRNFRSRHISRYNNRSN